MLHAAFRKRLVSVLLCLTATLSLGAAEKDSLTAPRILPGGGVADPAGKVGYFPSSGGGIVALDLDTGKRLWETKEANRPLLAAATRLYAQAPAGQNQMRVRTFDDRGKIVKESKTITFPDWVSIGVTYGRSFASTARLDGDRLLLIWQARAWYAGGARPTPDIERAARKQAEGVIRLDLAAGKVESLKGDQIPKGVPQAVPSDTGSARLGARTYSIMDQPIRGRPFQSRRLLQAKDADGKLLWEQEIAAPVHLLPLP